jgi:hypothetical protein
MAKSAQSAPRQIFKPTFKTYQNLSGGLNVLQPADQIQDNQSPDVLNLIYINGALQVDTGYTTYGGMTVGGPLQTIQFELTSGDLLTCLVTTSAFYIWDSGAKNWVLAMTPELTTTTTNTEVLTGSCWSAAFSTAFGPQILTGLVISFASVVGISVGDVVQIALEGGGTYNSSVVSITGDTITFLDPLLIGEIISDGSATTFYAHFNGGAYPISWTIDPPTNSLIWTNGVDLVQAFDGTGATAPLAGLSAICSTARLLTRFYGCTLAINTVESGVEYPYRVRNSTNVSSTQWDPETYFQAGFTDLIDTADAIISVNVLGPYLILGRENNIMTATYWGTATELFFFQYNFYGTGVLGGVPITGTPQYDVLVSPSGIFTFQGGFQIDDIGDSIFNYFLGPQGNMSPTYSDNLFTFFVEVLDEVWIFYPSTGATYCDTLLRCVGKYGNGWFPQTFPSEFAGIGIAYNSSALEWQDDTLTWEEKTTAWSSRAILGNYPLLLLASPSDRQVYCYNFTAQTRNGVSAPWYFTTKDFPVIDGFLTFDGIVAYGKGNDIQVAISTDYGQSFQTVGTYNFGTQFYTKQTLDYQVTGDFFRIRFSGVGYGFFLSQFSLRYLDASEY